MTQEITYNLPKKYNKSENEALVKIVLSNDPTDLFLFNPRSADTIIENFTIQNAETGAITDYGNISILTSAILIGANRTILNWLIYNSSDLNRTSYSNIEERNYDSEEDEGYDYELREGLLEYFPPEAIYNEVDSDSDEDRIEISMTPLYAAVLVNDEVTRVTLSRNGADGNLALGGYVSPRELYLSMRREEAASNDNQSTKEEVLVDKDSEPSNEEKNSTPVNEIDSQPAGEPTTAPVYVMPTVQPSEEPTAAPTSMTLAYTEESTNYLGDQRSVSDSSY